jgi:tetrahydromethanopterin S-methyltransferase subunit G
MNKITLSVYTNALFTALKRIKKRELPPDTPKIKVSQTVSFFAILYEKVRNAVEFREEHLIRRASIERILKRRLMLNPEGKGEGENLIRELLWARYLPNGSLTEQDIVRIQTIMDKYSYLKKRVIYGRETGKRIYFSDFINNLMTCEIEEELNSENTQINSAFLYYFYQVIKNKVLIKELNSELKDSYFYVASELAFAKNDTPYIRYHLFKLYNQSILTLKDYQIDSLGGKFPEIADRIDKTINNQFNDKLTRFIKKQVPPFLIVFTIIKRFPQELEKIFTNKEELWKKVDFICREKYQETGQKLRNAAIRSIIYIFLTKMVFILALEYPLSKYFYGMVELEPLAINTIFPPVLMGLIVSFFGVPSEKNTKRIFERIINILNKDPSFETGKALIAQKTRIRRPMLIFGFTIFYLLTFAITFSLIYMILDYLRFNPVSKAVFIFFVSVITFFGYRIRQTSKEYSLEEKESILSPVFDFFFIPVLSLGKFLSNEIAKLNIFILIFDFLIEAPFKLIFEIVEEWINFVRARKEEIV